MKKVILQTLLLIGVNFSSFGQLDYNVMLTGGVETSVILQNAQKNTIALLGSLNRAYSKKKLPDLSKGNLTKEGMETLLNIWEMTSFYCPKETIKERFLKKPGGGYEVRNIPVTLSESADQDKQQDMVIIFNDQGVIDNIYFSIETQRYESLVSEAKDVTENKRRLIILDFLENFKTSYNRKDLGYIESVFSEDALIITGRVLKVIRKDVSGEYMKQETVEYQKKTKAQYIISLGNVFRENRFLDVRFDSIQLVRHGKYPSLYGVSLLQTWKSTRYSDVGFLFLAVDFSNEDMPQIHVRTWQPTRVGDKNLMESEKFTLRDFNLKL